jgi:hypothetical protein
MRDGERVVGTSVADLVDEGRGMDQITVAVAYELRHLLLRTCRFDPSISDHHPPRIDHDGEIVLDTVRWPVYEMGLPGKEVELLVQWRGALRSVRAGAHAWPADLHRAAFGGCGSGRPGRCGHGRGAATDVREWRPSANPCQSVVMTSLSSLLYHLDGHVGEPTSQAARGRPPEHLHPARAVPGDDHSRGAVFRCGGRQGVSYVLSVDLDKAPAQGLGQLTVLGGDMRRPSSGSVGDVDHQQVGIG